MTPVWSHATELAELPVISAAHVLAVEIFYGVQRAFHDVHARPSDWIALSRDEKARYIDTAVAVLEMRRPKAIQIATGLGPTFGNVIGAIRPKESA